MNNIAYASDSNVVILGSWPQSQGSSEASKEISRYTSDWKKHRDVPTINRSRDKDISDLFNEINSSEYRLENWDGENALPIAYNTIKLAQFVLNNFGTSIPLPEVIPEPNGDVGLEWLNDEQHFVLSVCKDGSYTYACLEGKHGRHYGSGIIDQNGIPKRIMQFLKY